MQSFKQSLMDSLNWYTGGNFDNLNEALRKNKLLTEEQMFHLYNLDYAFNQAQPNQDLNLTVYKGIDNDQFYTIDRAFISTTTDIEEAMKFIDEESNCCILRIHIAPNSKVLRLRDISRYPEENEILLDRNGFMIRTGNDGQMKYQNGRPRASQTKFAGEPAVRNVRIIDCIYQAGSLF